MKQFRRKLPISNAVVTLTLILLLGFAVNSVMAQAVLQLRIGMLQSFFREDGMEPEHAFLKIQQTGLEYPALYPDQDHQAAKALWIGTSDFSDHAMYGGSSYPYKVVHVGPRGWDTEREFMPVEFKLIGRFDHPTVIVDGLSNVTDLINTENLDKVDPDLPAHRMIYNVVNTSIGVTMTRKIYAWGRKHHDNYFIYDYTFKNTGNMDTDPEIERPDQTLTDVWFFYQYRYVGTREGTDWTQLNSPRWGINQTLSNRGEFKESDSEGQWTYTGDYEDWLEGDANADSMRCTFAWMGRHSKSEYDLLGAPDVNYGTGRLGTPHFTGNITLHVDKAADDPSDDPTQPRTTSYQQSDDPPTRPNDQFDRTRMQEEWDWITRGHRKPRHDEAVGDGYPDLFEGTPGGFSNCIGYGPYTLGPGDSVRLVIAEGVDGLSRAMADSVGKEWYADYTDTRESSTFTLPDGSTTTDADEYKNAWVYTSQDSLFETFSYARANFENGYDMTLPPPPPDFFEVTSGGDRIQLSWSASAEGDPRFAGYRVYRAVAKPDTTYDLIFECGPGTDNSSIVNNYDDTTPIRGYSYYYYITTFGNDDQQLESSLFWTRTTEPAFLRRQPGASLQDIRVVPNPFVIRNRRMQYPGEPDKIMFLDIPGECTISIYTERGDKIATVEHNDGSGDETWNSSTEYGQVIVSGVYIAVFETPDGERAIRKFVVIR